MAEIGGIPKNQSGGGDKKDPGVTSPKGEQRHTEVEKGPIG